MNTRNIYSIFLMMLFICSKAVCGANWDLEYWQYFNKGHLECCLFKLYTTGVVRFNEDVSKSYFYRLTENFSYHALPSLDLEAHYSFIYHKPRGTSHFRTQSRLELEVNPIFWFDRGVTLHWRNRLEIIKDQNVSEPRYVLRERLWLAVPVCRGNATFNFYDEVFYNFNLKKVSENRFVPLSVSFGFFKRINIEAFLMVHNVFSADKWYNSFVFGTDFCF